MATILVVEDHAMSRQVLKNLFGYVGHRILEAADGTAAVALARAQSPDLIVSDIVMPVMDGIEFIRTVRLERGLASVPVIFYTATYRLAEARRLASEFGMCRVIHKPADPPFILEIVNEMLGITNNPDLGTENLMLDSRCSMLDKELRIPVSGIQYPASSGIQNSSIPQSLNSSISSNLEVFQNAALQLAMLMDLNFHLVGQRDPMRLLETCCSAIRSILNCRYARLALLEENGQTRYFGEDKREEPAEIGVTAGLHMETILDQVISGRSTFRWSGRSAADFDGKPESRCADVPFLILPFASRTRVYGWICIADKGDGAPFRDEDEEIAVALSTQTSIAYENILINEHLQRQAAKLRAHQLELQAQNEELRAAQQELEASRAKYADLYNLAPLGYFTLDTLGLIVEVNLAGANLLGIDKQLLLNKPFSLFVSEPDDNEVFTKHRKNTFISNNRQTCDLSLRRKDGTVFCVHLESTAVENADDKAGYIRTAVMDITERKQAEEALKQSHDELETRVKGRTSELAITIESLRDEIAERRRAEEALRESQINLAKAQSIAGLGSWSYDLGSKKVMWSEELYKIFGIVPGQSNGDLAVIVPKLVHPDDWVKVRTVYRRLLAKAKAVPLEYRITLTDGTKRVVWAETEMVFDEQGEAISIVGTVQDITKRKRAEEDLTRLVTAIESTADALVVTDPKKGTIQFVNRAFEKITGYTRDEVLGRDLHMLDSGTHNEIFYQNLRQTLTREGSWTGRLVHKKKDGTLYEEECTYSAVKNASGEIINYISIKRDVTEKVRLESIAQSVETMNNIGFIFTGVSHEVGNPINNISMTLNIIKNKLDTLSKEKLAEYIDHMSSEASRVSYLLKSLKNFNMYENLVPQQVEISSFLQRFLSMVKKDFETKGILMDCTVDSKSEYMFADPRALQQVLLNILMNAVDALEGREKPLISLSISDVAGNVRWRIEDNGRGIEEKRQKDLFKPFYTTKVKGTGLGLVITKKMLAKMNGTVQIISRPNEGTTVEISIPAKKI